MVNPNKVEMITAVVLTTLNSWSKITIKKPWHLHQQVAITEEREAHLVPIGKHLQKVEANNYHKIKSSQVRAKTEEPCLPKSARRTLQVQWQGIYSQLIAHFFRVIRKIKVSWREWSQHTFRITKASP